MNSDIPVKKILILAANPKGTSPLRLSEEVREITNGLQRASKRDQFQIEQRWAVRDKELRRAMLDFGPHIVHFCGHGDGQKGLILENETGQVQPVSAKALAEFFELFADNVECVVLNACYSEIQAREIVRHIDYVVGMRQNIGDEAAIKFAVAFYDALLAGRSVDFAYKLGCNAINFDDFQEEMVPMLIKKKLT